MLKQHGALIHDGETSRYIIQLDSGEEKELRTGDNVNVLLRGRWITGTLDYWDNEWRFVGVPAAMLEGAEVRV